MDARDTHRGLCDRLAGPSPLLAWHLQRASSDLAGLLLVVAGALSVLLSPAFWLWAAPGKARLTSTVYRRRTCAMPP